MLKRSLVPAFAFALVVGIVAGPAAADDETPTPSTATSTATPTGSVSRAATPATAAAPKAARQDDAAEKRAEAVRRVLEQPAPKSLNEALRRLDHIRVDVDFKDLELTEAVEFIGQLAGFNVIVGPELQKDGLDTLGTVTFKLRKASLKEVAELVARFTDTKLALSSGILSFTTPEAARGKPVLRIYSIADITTTIMNFPGPDLNLRSSDAEFEAEEPTPVENAFEDPDKIADMIQEFVESETWEDEKVSIYADGKRLIVRQYPAVHRKLARFLNMLRSSR